MEFSKGITEGDLKKFMEKMKGFGGEEEEGEGEGEGEKGRGGEEGRRAREWGLFLMSANTKEWINSVKYSVNLDYYSTATTTNINNNPAIHHHQPQDFNDYQDKIVPDLKKILQKTYAGVQKLINTLPPIFGRAKGATYERVSPEDLVWGKGWGRGNGKGWGGEFFGVDMDEVLKGDVVFQEFVCIFFFFFFLLSFFLFLFPNPFPPPPF